MKKRVSAIKPHKENSIDLSARAYIVIEPLDNDSESKGLLKSDFMKSSRQDDNYMIVNCDFMVNDFVVPTNKKFKQLLTNILLEKFLVSIRKYRIVNIKNPLMVNGARSYNNPITNNKIDVLRKIVQGRNQNIIQYDRKKDR